jgi:serine/threonine protein kinase
VILIKLLSWNIFIVLLGHLTAKSDVYSFGVVLLEMISGRRAIDKNLPAGEHNLVEWAKPYLSNKRRVFRVMDPRLEGQYSHSKAHAAAALASQCLSVEPRVRPTMDEVVKTLEQLQEPKESQKKGSDHRIRSSGLGHNASGKGNADAAKKASAYPRPSASLLHV